jgi:hypothetical protein
VYISVTEIMSGTNEDEPTDVVAGGKAAPITASTATPEAKGTTIKREEEGGGGGGEDSPAPDVATAIKSEHDGKIVTEKADDCSDLTDNNADLEEAAAPRGFPQKVSLCDG